MDPRDVLEKAPVWLIALGLAATLLLAKWAGARVRGGHKGEEAAKIEASALDYLLSAAVGLMALLIAFTFSFASERFANRRELGIDEANAVSTAYLRYQVLNEPHRTRLSGLMVRYIDAREAFNSAGEDDAKVAVADRETDALQRRIWDELADAIRTSPGPTCTPLLQATNQMFDLAGSRRAALDFRVPQAVLWALIIYATIASGVMGYTMPRERPLIVVSTIVVLLVTLAISLIVDIDRPRGGAVVIRGGALERVDAMVAAMEREKITRAPPPA
jgi:hypothetical protein